MDVKTIEIFELFLKLLNGKRYAFTDCGSDMEEDRCYGCKYLGVCKENLKESEIWYKIELLIKDLKEIRDE